MYQQQPPQWQPPRPPVRPGPRPKRPVPRWVWFLAAGWAAVFVVLVVVVAVFDPPKDQSAAPAVSASRTSSAATQKSSTAPSTLPKPKASPWWGTGDCPAGPDLLVWMKSPGAPATAQALGSYDSAECRKVQRKSTAFVIEHTSPTGPGQCTQAAYASDNPGYEARWLDGSDALTVVPPRLKHVILSVGDGC